MAKAQTQSGKAGRPGENRRAEPRKLCRQDLQRKKHGTQCAQPASTLTVSSLCAA